MQKLGLKHVVITSVDRDDLDDGGAEHFAQTIRAIRHRAPGTTIEVLIPDFLKCGPEALEVVVAARPDVLNHNLETVPGLYPEVRPGARYFHSLRLLQRVKELDPTMFTKSGIMVGLGEDRQGVTQVMDDMRAADVDFLTIGQYLQPTPKHHHIARFVTPDEFKAYEKSAYGKGFLMVSATPLTRSSYHAGDDFARLRAARMVWAKCSAPPSSRSSRSTDVTTTCFSPNSLTACATRPGSNVSSAVGLPVATLQKVQPRVQISPMIIMVAWPADQHSPTLGQPASSQTVTSFFSFRMSRVCL